MSTPTTATATLPHYLPHHYPFSRPLHAYAQPPNTSSVRSAAQASLNPPPSLLPTAARVPPLSATSTATAGTTAYHQPAYLSSASSSSSSSGHGPANGLALSPSTSRSAHDNAEPTPRAESSSNNHYTTMPVVCQTLAATRDGQHSRKRRRSREPDWHTFYKNGLPKEIIVIDDTPEPSDSAAAAAATGTASQTLTNGSVNGASNDAAARHAAKKLKRDDEHARYDPIYHVGTSHTGTPSGSTISSSDRTNSAIHTTAATSLGSLSSNGHYDYDAQPGQKRKRTRQQLANEAKKREAAVEDAFASYKPPPRPPKKASEVHVKVIADNSQTKNVKVDDDDGHYIVTPDADLTERYQMIKLLGQGTFGKVVQARDRKRSKLVAIKIIRSVQKYRDASRIELRVLATLKANDEENRNRCIHLRDCFDFRGHICIVMDLLGQSVFDFLKSNNFVPFPNSQIQSFARQLFTSVAFLHDLNLIHTDLKPENILLCNNDYQTFTYSRKIPSSSSTVSRQATQRRVLLDTEIRLIDFGSATFQDEYHSSVVSTRHYRAPEIILGLGWSFPCDIWSIGCILVEFFTGDALFQTHDNLEHLAMMEAVCDSRINSHLVSQVNKMNTRNGGNPASKYFKRAKLDYPTTDTTRASRRFVKAMKRLTDIIPKNSQFLCSFLDLLEKIFVYDPAHRITAKQALQHPWFKETAHPDDGTEAARIRMDRLRLQQEQAASRLPPLHS